MAGPSKKTTMFALFDEEAPNLLIDETLANEFISWKKKSFLFRTLEQ